MSDGCKLILIPFTGRKKRKAWNKTRGKYVPEERRRKIYARRPATLLKTDSNTGALL